MTSQVFEFAPRGTEDAARFLREAHDGPLTWERMCLSLQRQARGLPVVYPSALTAAAATPEEDRVYEVKDLKRGMIAYSDDPSDANPYGHIYFICGRNKNGVMMTWSNDVKRRGGVDLVPLSFYQNKWGDGFQFGATSLNNFTFSEFEPPKPVRPSLGDNFANAIENVEKAIRFHEKRGHGALVRALKKDLAEMEQTAKRFK